MAAHEEQDEEVHCSPEALVENSSVIDSESASDTISTISTRSNYTKDDTTHSPIGSIISMASSTSKRTNATSSSTTAATPSPNAANISIREYIYFTPHPLPPNTPVPYSTGLPHRNPLNLPKICFEPTSTLVLTSPNNTFLDIRLYKPIHPTSTTPLPNKSEPGRLEWAFAGHSASVPVRIHGWEGKPTMHSTWTHWVDSRHAVGAGAATMPVDEGVMYPLTADLTLEVGHAFHPALGRVSGHEELWRDVAVQRVPDLTPSAAAVAATPADSAAADSAPTTANLTVATTAPSATITAITLRFHDARANIRGLVVRVGQFCQGILMKGRDVTVERWEFVGGGDNGGGARGAGEGGGDVTGAGEQGERAAGWVDGWKRTARVGGLYLPCSAAFRPRVLRVGGVVRYREFEWVVEEVWEW